MGRKMIYLDDAIEAFADMREGYPVVHGDMLSDADVVAILQDLPSANPDLSGYSDRLWRGAYDCGYERCKQDAIDALADYIRNVDRVYSTGLLSTTDCIDAARSVLDDLPSAQPDLLGDGTLMMTVPQGMLGDVKRVLVDEFGTKNCKVMYQDAERKKGEWIIDKDCEGKSRTVTCNICGHKEFNWHDPNYCENCGADMRGEEHETD